MWPWLLALLLVVLGGLGAYWYFTKEDKSASPRSSATVKRSPRPNVRDAGFEPESRREESAKPVDVVIGQNPEAGTELEEGKTVILIVSAGPETVAVPNVVGKSRDEAVAAVQAAGFDAKVTEVFADKPDGTVVETDARCGDVGGEGLRCRAEGFQGRQAGRRPGRRRDDLVGGDEDAARTPASR